MTEILFIGVGVVLGAIIGYLIGKQQKPASGQAIDEDKLQVQLGELNQEVAVLKSQKEDFKLELGESKQAISQKSNEVLQLHGQLAEVKTKFQNTTQANEELKEKNSQLEHKAGELQLEINKLNQSVSTYAANYKALQEKLDSQKEEMNELRKQFNLEFQNIANKILEENSTKFSAANKEQLTQILDPLKENISQFKEQVEKSYTEERKEVFSLGNMVKQLTDLNKTMSEETKNLTQALKGESKTQGLWGEMILESILEKSGLRKNEEYFMEEQLTDEAGNPLRSDSENKKMRPDAVIKYPDNRTVIIDSKVSLNAYARFIETDDLEQQKVAIKAHVQAIKNHVTALSAKGYDDYDKSLDFVLMFIPSESAYIAAVKEDPRLWEFAYDKRILLMNPTNLVTSLKLIVDLWKREYQNQNAIEIAERGGKLYDKFVGFVENLEKVGAAIKKAGESYNDAYKQLSTGRDNLVRQAEKLHKMGAKGKKELSISSDPGTEIQ